MIYHLIYEKIQRNDQRADSIQYTVMESHTHRFETLDEARQLFAQKVAAGWDRVRIAKPFPSGQWHIALFNIDADWYT